MDKLQVIKKSEELGGSERRAALEKLMLKAHQLGCDSEVGGGRIGGINFRYGSIRYALLDVNVEGEVKLYVQPHPNKSPPPEISDLLNGYIKDNEHLKVKSFPLTCYGHLEGKLEELPSDALFGYLTASVKAIREEYYKPSRVRRKA